MIVHGPNTEPFVGVVTALALEARSIRALQRIHLRSELVCPVQVRFGGMGATAASDAAVWLRDCGATALISVGFAAALNCKLIVGSVMVPGRCVGPQGEIPICERLRGAIIENLQMCPLQCNHSLVEVPAVLVNPRQKSQWQLQSGCDMADMESAAIGAVAATAGLPFAVLRVISDDARGTYPRCLYAAVNAEGRTRPLAVLNGLIMRPWELAAVLDATRGYLRASRALRNSAAQLNRAAHAAEGTGHA